MDYNTIPTYAALLTVKYTSRLLYDLRMEWVGEVAEDPWERVRLIAILHHTSLAEGVYLAAVPNRVLRQMARHAVLPVAEETMARPIEGRIFRALIPNAVPITRKRDRSWARVLARIDDPESMVALFPEGRMMRTTGRDKRGEPMTVKPGIAEVLRSLGPGRMILAYSGGLHHVFPPGARLPRYPRFRQPIHVRVESLDIETYVADRRAEGGSFSAAIVRDLTRRRDLHTPIAPGTPSQVAAEVRRRRERLLREEDRGSGDDGSPEVGGNGGPPAASAGKERPGGPSRANRAESRA